MTNASTKVVILSTILATGVISGCSDNDETAAAAGAVTTSTTASGFVVMDSLLPVGESISALRVALDSNDAITALPVIDHQANAMSVELELRPTSLQLFGNPALGTPLMQVNQMAGLDLPQKIFAWEDDDGSTQLGYNSADYLQQRHALTGDGATASLGTIANALNAFATAASGSVGAAQTDTAASGAVSSGEGIITLVSTNDMDTTYSTLVTSIQNNENLRLVVELDHAANAQNVSLDLDPTRLVIFGNPNAGTPLMQATQTIGIDLPQKMLVFENAEGVVTIAYNDPTWLADRHGITGQDDRLTAISGLLSTLANSAAGIETEE